MKTIKAFLVSGLANWKTTVSGLLTTIIGVASFLAAAHANPAQFAEWSPFLAMVPLKVSGWIMAAAVPAKLIMAWIQKDPNKQLAKVPGIADPQFVPAHQVPDDKSAKAVTSAAIALLAVLALGALTGCMHSPQVATQPAPAQTIYQRAAVIMDSVATEGKTAQDGLISLHKSGAVPDAIYKNIQGVFHEVGVYGPQIDKLIADGASPADLATKVNALIADLTNISTTSLDPGVAQQVQIYANSVIVVLKQLLPLFTGAANLNQEVTPWIQQPSPNSHSLPNSSSFRASEPINSTRLQQQQAVLTSSRLLTSSRMQTRNSIKWQLIRSPKAEAVLT